MPTASRRVPLPFLVPLLLAATLLLLAVSYLLGGSPVGRPRGTVYTNAPADERATAFSVVVNSDSITFNTKGFGHRVGMSQYGADAMALEGSTYRQILAHYYRGTILTTLEN